MTICAPDVRLGAQRPRVSSVPRSVTSSGVEAVELAASVGVFLDPWQQLFLTDCLGERVDGKWAAREAGLLVARQNGKGEVLLCLGLAGLFLLEERLVMHSAHEFKTAAEAFLRIKTVIDGSDDLRRQVKTIRTSHGEEGIELTDGRRLRFVARSKSSGRGFTGDRIILDEAQQLPMRAVRALIPTLRARPNPQIIYTGTVPSAENDAEHWESVRDRGRAGSDPRLLWHEYSPPGAESGAVDPDVRDNWYASNPALGIRITEEDMESERETFRSDPDGFSRELMSVWPEDSVGAAINFRRWADLADPDAPRGVNPVFGVATAPDRSWSAVGVAWKRPDGAVQVMLAEYREHATWVAEHVAGLRKRWNGRVLVDIASRDLVFDAEELSPGDLAKAHNALSDAVTAGRVHHGNERALNVAVKGSQWRLAGDTRVLDRKGQLDISPLAAVALAAYGAAAPPVKPGRFVVI